MSDIETIALILREERQQADRLYQALSAHEEPLSTVWRRSLELFNGNVYSALAWFRRPNRELAGVPPSEHALTEADAEHVLRLIGRIEHGVVS